jgi:F0F1-type ATP synthase membrane subunit b/b'
VADLALELKKRKEEFEEAKDKLRTAEANASVADKQLAEVVRVAKGEFGVSTLEELQALIQTKETSVQGALKSVADILSAVK